MFAFVLYEFLFSVAMDVGLRDRIRKSWEEEDDDMMLFFFLHYICWVLVLVEEGKRSDGIHQS